MAKKQFGLRLSDEMKERIRLEAKEQGRSKNGLIEFILDKNLPKLK